MSCTPSRGDRPATRLRHRLLLAVVLPTALALSALALTAVRAVGSVPSLTTDALRSGGGWPAPRASASSTTADQECTDDSPHDGDCSVCHASPPGDSSVELVTPDVDSLCLGCHDGSGADTDVLRGRSTGTGDRLNGGGFLYAPDSEGVLRPVTSRHEVAGLPLAGGGTSDGVKTAWGSLGPSASGPGATAVLTCTACHDPHGSSNYRLLRDADNGYPYDDPAAHRWLPYDPYLGDWVSQQVLPTSGEGNADDCNYTSDDVANYTAGMRDFCATCHSEYLSGGHGVGGSQPYDAGDGNGAVPRFRHAQAVEYRGPLARPLRLAAPAVTDTARTSVVCTSCHFAHGSSATVHAYGDAVPPAGDSALLYYDGRGVCLACHQFDK